MNMNARHDMPVSDKVFYHVFPVSQQQVQSVIAGYRMPLSPTKVAMARAEDGLQTDNVLHAIETKQVKLEMKSCPNCCSDCSWQ